jgi:hypothetical protein
VKDSAERDRFKMEKSASHWRGVKEPHGLHFAFGFLSNFPYSLLEAVVYDGIPIYPRQWVLPRPSRFVIFVPIDVRDCHWNLSPLFSSARVLSWAVLGSVDRVPVMVAYSYWRPSHLAVQFAGEVWYGVTLCTEVR